VAARGGHEQSVYPSYYPHEIEIAMVAPERAAELLRSGKMHAYAGSASPAAVGDGKSRENAVSRMVDCET
jgi:hypothetical protein